MQTQIAFRKNQTFSRKQKSPLSRAGREMCEPFYFDSGFSSAFGAGFSSAFAGFVSGALVSAGFVSPAGAASAGAGSTGVKSTHSKIARVAASPWRWFILMMRV
jgi:hypothetical protein